MAVWVVEFCAQHWLKNECTLTGSWFYLLYFLSTGLIIAGSLLMIAAMIFILLFVFQINVLLLSTTKGNCIKWGPGLLWQYGLWSFQAGGTKLERFLPKNQHTQRKLLNFENWCSGELLHSCLLVDPKTSYLLMDPENRQGSIKWHEVLGPLLDMRFWLNSGSIKRHEVLRGENPYRPHVL